MKASDNCSGSHSMSVSPNSSMTDSDGIWHIDVVSSDSLAFLPETTTSRHFSSLQATKQGPGLRTELRSHESTPFNLRPDTV